MACDEGLDAVGMGAMDSQPQLVGGAKDSLLIAAGHLAHGELVVGIGLERACQVGWAVGNGQGAMGPGLVDDDGVFGDVEPEHGRLVGCAAHGRIGGTGKFRHDDLGFGLSAGVAKASPIKSASRRSRPLPDPDDYGHYAPSRLGRSNGSGSGGNPTRNRPANSATLPTDNPGRRPRSMLSARNKR